MEFEADLLNNLLRLSRTLQGGTYLHGSYSHKIINEKKRRDIAVASVADRIVHRLLYNYLVKLYNQTFLYDVWSCRKNKGLEKCVARVSQILRRHYGIYIWRADITKFFQSVDRPKLKQILARRITDPSATALLREVIDSYSEPGIPIGNLTSQIFANIYLNEFDRYIVHTLKPLHYLRYGDDFLLFDLNHENLTKMRTQAVRFLEQNLRLQVNPKLDKIQSSKQQLSYLGMDFFANGNYRMARATQSRVRKALETKNLSCYKSKVDKTLPRRYAKRLLYDYLAQPQRLWEEK